MPDGDPGGRADIVQPDRFTEAADPSRLDVDDASRSQLDHVLRTVDVGDGLVEADRRSQAPLQLRVAREVIAPKRLFDHDQVERVELREDGHKLS